MAREDDYSRRGNDLILAQGEQALVQDGTSGIVGVIVGPHKIGLTETDRPVQFDPRSGRFTKLPSLEQAVTPWATAREGEYLVLENPVKADPTQHPSKGRQEASELDMGRKVNIPGPVTFALFPGQAAERIVGHTLRSNQYVVVRVISGEEARRNWATTIVKSAKSESGDGTEDGQSDADKVLKDEVPDLVTGQLLVICGTKVSFYIPPTGVEVVPDERGQHVREAVTLEQLEYAILQGEDGSKEYRRGPAVVFPRPDQQFYTDSSGRRKFRAIELGDNWGLYVKVIKAYKDEERGEEYAEGDELFITGKQQRIYFPRPEHSIIKYGDQAVQFGVAIPKGEGRYVLDRNTGDVPMVRGPKMFLPDPRNEVIVRRVLPLKLVRLLYPGNQEAETYNASLLSKGASPKAAQRGMDTAFLGAAVAEAAVMDKAQLVAEEFERRTSYTPPRSIQLDTKYDGAVTVNVWTGYAVKIVDKTGNSRVAVGPVTVLLEYDETPEVFELSTGTPKSHKNKIQDVYLRVEANKVSDVVMDAVTADHVHVEIPLSYRVNFEGDSNKWFNVEDYVGFLCDHLRSLIRNLVKQKGIEELNRSYITLIRDAVLGQPGEDGKRSGRIFVENGMRVYDIEFGALRIGDARIEQLLQDSQQESVRSTLELEMQRKRVETEKEQIRLHGEKVQAETEAQLARTSLTEQVQKRNAEVEMQRIELEGANAAKRAALDETQRKGQLRVESDLKQSRADADLALQEALDAVHAAELARDKAASDQQLSVEQAEQNMELATLRADVEATKEKAAAITPHAIAALQKFSDREFTGKVTEALSPLAILGGKSVAEVAGKLLSGLPNGISIDELMKARNVTDLDSLWERESESDE